MVHQSAWSYNRVDEMLLEGNSPRVKETLIEGKPSFLLKPSHPVFGIVVPLVVREVAAGTFETIDGAQRLGLLPDSGHTTFPCVVTRADDGEARLLSQALNHIAGQDNPGLRGEVLRRIMESTPGREVAELLPGPFEREILKAYGNRNSKLTRNPLRK